VVSCSRIDKVSPPEGGSYATGDTFLVMEKCKFTNPFYEEIWNSLPRTGNPIKILDHMVSLDNFALMRQCTLEDFARLADEETRVVNVTAWDVSKINSAAALASNVLRRAAEFVYF
jgi:hypothetical protein